jgi:hypothetical protein
MKKATAFSHASEWLTQGAVKQTAAAQHCNPMLLLTQQTARWFQPSGIL